MKVFALLILIGVLLITVILRRTEPFVNVSTQQQPSSTNPTTAVNNSSDTDATDRYNTYQFANPRNGMTVMHQTPEGPYANDHINDTSDYDMQQMDNITSWRKVNDRTAKALTSRKPMYPDWSEMPNDADKFQIKRQDFINGIYSKPQPPDSAFKALEGGDVMPPDQNQIDSAEAAMIAEYAPQKSAGLTKYSVEDAKDFINKFYNARGKIPEIVEDPKFPNVYQVVGVQDKNPKIVWEPEAPSSPDAVSYLGEDTINVPQVAVEKADPFFFGEGKGYKSWTPGLERMFAPTYAKSSWY